MKGYFFRTAQRALDAGRVTPFDLVGYIPSFLNEISSDDAVSQLDRHYSHGGGWKDFQGHTFVDDPEEPSLQYPGDPPMIAVCEWKLREERIILFQSAWVAVIQPDGSYRVSRMD